VNVPNFPECDHKLVQSLYHLSDQALVKQFKQHSDAGRYFAAIFCRYSPIVYSLIRHSARSPIQAEYLFALTWRHILHELGGVNCDTAKPETSVGQEFGLQNWIINVTALCINQAVVPDVESIHYSLAKASPPFWCYVEQALDQLPPTERLVLVMALTFRWSETRIAAYLQAEGEQLSPAQLGNILGEAYKHLESALPEDIREIYLGPLAASDMDLTDADSLADWLDVPELVGTSLEPDQT
jgi:hypothetical protein